LKLNIKLGNNAQAVIMFWRRQEVIS
jgi:hypothetical protein